MCGWATDGQRSGPEDFTSGSFDLAQKTVYLCGDVSRISDRRLDAAARLFVIRKLSHGYREDADSPWPVVDPGQVPIRVHGAGVYYRRFFDLGSDHFERIRAEHAFQSLTESTKPGTAHRSGIYLTPVTRNGDELYFRLLRCSTNLSGRPRAFRPTDTRIVEALNREAAAIFRNQAPLNHVPAHIYHNTPATDERKQSKAKISAHADKTKDMPANGVMAFCALLHRGPFDRSADETGSASRIGGGAAFRSRFAASSPHSPPCAGAPRRCRRTVLRSP
ncbi:hypothetical protein GCM10009527_033440 [Actinomadura nitritigenes]|uniref:TauD/TfdA-like domain-containing protein n=1 Tax=Actinomadura nitritigenes TaxID=134602 RepID=A0ABS3RD48_9ACTN|nr:hypothetical protein [Actinomadura nitritigenes]MBO2443514.1 hypothetical protein [Actinomadura nitritigenes]